MRWITRLIVVMICASLVLVTATSDATAPYIRIRCPLDPKLVPTCGTLWGVTPPAPTYESLLRSESAAGRRFDFVYRFHDLNDEIPDAQDRAVLATGAIMHFAIDARDFGHPETPWVTWSDIAAGRFDNELMAQAKGIASIGRPVFVTLDHEPDQARHRIQGSPADYVRAWRHVHQLYARVGATNAVWVWVVMGWMPAASIALQMWPGNDVVDWISWEAYDDAGCRSGPAVPDKSLSFAHVVQSFYIYLLDHGRQDGIDTTKPIMISETASAVAAMSTKPSRWYQSIPPYLSTNPRIKAVGLWDHMGRPETCSFQFSSDPSRSSDVATAGRDSWVNPLSSR